MAAKLSSFLPFSRKIPKWVHLSAYFSTMSCAETIQIMPENDRNTMNSKEFEPKVQFLKNKLNPVSLIWVLNCTNDLNFSMKLFKWASLQKGFCHTEDTYYKMILKLGMAGNVEDMGGFCNDMVRERCPGAEEALLALIKTFVKHGKLSEASRVLVVVNLAGCKPSVGVFNDLLGAFVQEKRDFQSVLFIYKEMVKAGIAPTTETLNYLLEALFEAGRVDTALDQYRRMNKKGCSPNSKTFEILINGLIASHRIEQSTVVLGDMFELGIQPDLKFYTSTIVLFCRINKLKEGLQLFRMMRASNILPDPSIHGSLIHCVCENLHVVDAMKLLEEIMDDNVTLTGDMCVNIVTGFCKLGQFNEAAKFLEDKQVLDTCPHNALLEGYCNAGKFLVAKTLFDKMFESNIVDTTSWNILIRYLSDNARFDKALEFLSRMIVSSHAPDSATYSALVVGTCKLSEYEKALELFDQVYANCWVLDSVSYAELVECLCCKEIIQEAVQVFCYMSNNRCAALRPSSFNMLIKGICKTGEVDIAIKMLSLAFYSGTSYSNATFNTIMLGLSKLEKANNLLVLLSRMLVEGRILDLEAYCILIESMITFGQIRECILFFNMMINEGLLPNSEILTNLLSCVARHSKLHMILPSINKLVFNHEILNLEMYKIIINVLWKEGYKTVASQLLDQMLDKGWVPDVHTHGLLIDSVVGEEMNGEIAVIENCNVEDNVSSILAESLGDA